jgi:hypothetical protein
MDPISRLVLRLAMLLRNPPGRRQAIAMLVALAALAIGAADRVFGLWPQEGPPAHGPLFRWRGP